MNGANDRVYATGKRKNAVARVWLKKGDGKILINGRSVDEYIKRPILEVMINTPFAVTSTAGQFDVNCFVSGGGLSGQAGAIRHAIARAMTIYSVEAYRKELKSAGFLTRDPRVVERKKPGLKKARKGQVFSKR
ncbi:MAG: 30S ribosomal protein S9 [Rickettsiales bacterium]|nr:30S ribosomal protein S9 [Rickettsiales bacterium]